MDVVRVFNCEPTHNEKQVTVKNLEEGEKMMDIVQLFKLAEKNRREWMLEEINENFDAMRAEKTVRD